MYSERTASCGARIKKALYLRRMKQVELCEITKIPKSALSQYISGAFEPKQDRIYLIAKALNVSEAWLMGYDVPMEREKISLEEPKLSEGEKMWLGLYHQLSDETKKVFVNMMDSFDELPADTQRFLLDAIRIAFGNQK